MGPPSSSGPPALDLQPPRGQCASSSLQEGLCPEPATCFSPRAPAVSRGQPCQGAPCAGDRAEATICQGQGVQEGWRSVQRWVCWALRGHWVPLRTQLGHSQEAAQQVPCTPGLLQDGPVLVSWG